MNRKLHKKVFKRNMILLLLLGSVTLTLLTGCQSKKKAEDEEAYRQYGIVCMREGRYQEAVDAFNLALGNVRGTVGPNEIDICYYKAEAQYLNGDYAGAEETYTALLDYKKQGDVYFLRGNLYLQQQMTTEALSDFENAVKTSKNDYELYLSIADTLAINGMQELSTEYLNDGLKINGATAYDKMQKGRLYLALGDSDSAIKYLSNAVEKEYAPAYYYIAEAYEVAGDSADAQKYYDLYLEAGIADSKQLCEIANRVIAKGNDTLALQYIEQALAMEEVTNRPELLKAKAIACENTGDFATAEECLAEYLVYYPNDEAAQREMVFLSTR